MDWFWWMIGGVVILAVAALVTALYMWKLYKQFPETIKAKVVSIEKIQVSEDSVGLEKPQTKKYKYRYHFKGRNKGNRMMTDAVTYKEKKFKIGEKITVRMSASGGECHSSFPLWPTATSAICILLALVLMFVYVSDNKQTTMEENATTLRQESGRYIVTDTGTYMDGDTLGLIYIEGEVPYVSTGDYGPIFYMGDPHIDTNNIPCVHILTATVSEDGAMENINVETLSKLESLNVTVDATETVYADLAAAESATQPNTDTSETHIHDDGSVHVGDHSEENTLSEDVENEETIPSEISENEPQDTIPTE